MTRRVLVIPDCHAPNHDRKAVAAVQAYASTQWWDDLVILGDLGDFDSVNGHNRGRPGLQEGKRLKADVEATRSLLEDFVYAARARNHACSGRYLLGNHEDRVGRAAQVDPAWMDAIVLAEGLDVENLGVKLYPYTKRKAALRIGKLHFLHGSYFGENAVKKHLDRLSCSFVMGHIHRLLVVTKPSQHGTMLGACVGHLADRDIGESYLDGPEGWTQGFGEAFIHDNGNFNLYPIAVTKGAFVAPDGRRYSHAGWDRLLAPIGLSASTNPASHHDRNRKQGGQAHAQQSERTGRDSLPDRRKSGGAKSSSSRGGAKRKRQSP